MARRPKEVSFAWPLCAALLLCGGPALIADQSCSSIARDDQLLVQWRTSAQTSERIYLLSDQGIAHIASLPALGIDLVRIGEVDALTTIMGASGIAWVEPNYLAQPASLPEPNDPAYHEVAGDLWVQWPLRAMEALPAWELYPGDFFTASSRPPDGPIVAVVDTGVDEGHPDFFNPGATSAEVAAGGQLMLSGALTFLSDQSSSPLPGAHDEHGHGTHLASLIAAASNNSAGIAGVAYPTRLLPLKVAGANGVAAHADIARAITYAADQGAAVILLGMAGPSWSQTLQAAIDYAWERGCLLVAPAGDAGDSTPMFPGACPHVFAVAATTEDGVVADYSTRGNAALAGPGGDERVGIYSALPTYVCKLREDLTSPIYGWLAGASQAAAHVAGAAALYAGARRLAPTTGEEGAFTWQALQQSARGMGDIGPGGWDPSFGYGLVALYPLVSGERPRAASVGSIVGRVARGDIPVVGATVTATPQASGPAATASSGWPAGGYRIANAPSGEYLVIAELDGKMAAWEGVRVMPGCDAPGVDFRLDSPPAGAELVASEIPKVAVCDAPYTISITLKNSGAPSWTRGQGFQLIRTASERPLGEQPDHANLPTPEPVPPGMAATFSVTLTTPEQWGLYTTAWQMCQQGGVGRFGPGISETVSVTSFFDVPADHWAVAPVEAVKTAEVAFGYAGHLYHPDWPVTRDQMAVYISRALAGGDEKVPTSPAQVSFQDVPADHWAYKYVEYAKAQNIVEGYPDGEYKPTLELDRGQMAVFIARAIATPTGEAGVPDPGCADPPFPDVPCGFWARKHIEYLRDRGVTHGYPNGNYHPEYTCTRDQMAVYIAKAFGLPL